MKTTEILDAIEAVQNETQADIDSLVNNVQSIINMQRKLNALLMLLDAAQGEDKAQAAPTSEKTKESNTDDKYIIMQGDKYYCHAGGAKMLKTHDEIKHLGLEVIKLGEIEAILLVKSGMYGDLCYGGEIIKLYPEPQPSENTEQLPTCTHKHWERQNTGTQLIHNICSTCGEEKFD